MAPTHTAADAQSRAVAANGRLFSSSIAGHDSGRGLHIPDVPGKLPRTDIIQLAHAAVQLRHDYHGHSPVEHRRDRVYDGGPGRKPDDLIIRRTPGPVLGPGGCGTRRFFLLPLAGSFEADRVVFPL